MPRKSGKSAKGRVAAILLSTLWVGWLLRRVERDYEDRGKLSAQASFAGWALYMGHLWLTLSAALRRRKSLPAGKTMGRTLPAFVGGASALFGAYLFTAGVREFRSFEQMSGVETGQLVKSGPYRYSRNPQVVGWGLALFGAALAGRSVRALVLVGLFFLVHRLYFSIEERHLERTFGEEYRRYRAEAPRFLGLPRAG